MRSLTQKPGPIQQAATDKSSTRGRTHPGQVYETDSKSQRTIVSQILRSHPEKTKDFGEVSLAPDFSQTPVYAKRPSDLQPKDGALVDQIEPKAVADKAKSVSGSFQLGAINGSAERVADDFAQAIVAPKGGTGKRPLHGLGSVAPHETLSSTPLSRPISTELTALTGQTGHSLPRDIRFSMEERLGLDLSHIRVHQGEKAAKLSLDLGASAFSIGNHIVFGQGQFRPGSIDGQKLIAHEIAHTLQPRKDKVIRRSPHDPQQMMVEINRLILSDKGNEITSEQLSMLDDARLDIVLSTAMLHLKDLLKKHEEWPTFEIQITRASNLGREIMRIQGFRKAVIESNNFVTHAPKVRAKITGAIDTALFNTMLPRIPKFLEALLKGGEATPSREDKLFSGYLTENAVRALADKTITKEVTADVILDAMTVAPRNVARAFFAAGDDIDMIYKAVMDEIKSCDKGIKKKQLLEEEKSTWIGSNIENVALGLEKLQEIPGTLYSCFPTSGLFGGMSRWARNELNDHYQQLDDKATKTLGNLPDTLVRPASVETVGISPNDKTLFERVEF